MTTPARKLLTPQMRRRLVSARKAKGISQETLARELEYTLQHVATIEAGRAQPSWQLLEQWCEVVGLELRVSIETPNARIIR